MASVDGISGTKTTTVRGTRGRSTRAAIERPPADGGAEQSSTGSSALTGPDHQSGMMVVGIFGAFQSHALVFMTADRAKALLGDDPIGAAAPTFLLNAVERDLELVRERSPSLADSALAASAMAMALEISNPYNSATSKAMCQARLADALKELRELSPAKEAKDGIDELAAERARRRAGGATA